MMVFRDLNREVLEQKFAVAEAEERERGRYWVRAKDSDVVAEDALDFLMELGYAVYEVDFGTRRMLVGKHPVQVEGKGVLEKKMLSLEVDVNEEFLTDEKFNKLDDPDWENAYLEFKNRLLEWAKREKLVRYEDVHQALHDALDFHPVNDCSSPREALTRYGNNVLEILDDGDSDE